MAIAGWLLLAYLAFCHIHIGAREADHQALFMPVPSC
jgi:hypothetical protein